MQERPKSRSVNARRHDFAIEQSPSFYRLISKIEAATEEIALPVSLRRNLPRCLEKIYSSTRIDMADCDSSMFDKVFNTLKTLCENQKALVIVAVNEVQVFYWRQSDTCARAVSSYLHFYRDRIIRILLVEITDKKKLCGVITDLGNI